MSGPLCRAACAGGAALALAAGLWIAAAASPALAARPRAAKLPAAFSWLVPRAAPASWAHATLPSGGAVLSYPSSMHRVLGDKYAISVGETDRAGTIHLYLNATPKQGAERLRTWAAFRITHNRSESRNVHEDARAQGLRFRGGTGSCVIDDYLTGPQNHHYHEIACLVVGRTATSVIVAAALQPDWRRARPLLERAVAAYRVS